MLLPRTAHWFCRNLIVLFMGKSGGRDEAPPLKFSAIMCKEILFCVIPAKAEISELDLTPCLLRCSRFFIIYFSKPVLDWANHREVIPPLQPTHVSSSVHPFHIAFNFLVVVVVVVNYPNHQHEKTGERRFADTKPNAITTKNAIIHRRAAVQPCVSQSPF